ncbi:hypothetical protein [Hymenobacter rubidus]|uniref:hypothetical protein n=1 Tax=Hymenobacter rubidus TaxID=1441626 RepID=UPI00191F2D7F|nr:hypothetical protein [Hymenobacter rubidus]
MRTITRLSLQRWKLRVAASAALTGGFLASAAAQQAPATIRLLPEDAERGLGGPQHNFDFLPPGVTGNEYKTAGFFGQKLRPYLAGHPDALAALDLYKRQKTIFLIDRLVAVGSFGVWGQQIFADGTPQYFNGTQKVALGVFAVSILSTAFINHNTNSYLQRAVNSYNGNLSHSGWWPRLRPAAVGLGAAPTGQPVLALRWTVR